MGAEGIGKSQGSSGSSGVYGAQPALGHGVSLMNAGDIMLYVTRALSEIGAQLNDYKNIVKERQEKAKDIREILSQVRDMTDGGDLKGYDEAKYNALMTRMEKYKNDPNVAIAYERFTTDYGGYINTETGQKMGILAGEDGKWIDNGEGDSQDMCLNAAEMKNITDALDSALQSLNSDNELVMMSLQQLMQQRNQISQFGSNAMNMLNEGAKSIVGNLR